MSGTSSHDDGFREIHLSGKQLVFLFMAVTVVLVVTFLTGVLVGRGVRAERSEVEQARDLEEPPPPAVSPLTPGAVSPEDDPTKAAPPAPAEDDADGKLAKTPEPEEAPKAIERNPPPAAAASTPAPATNAPVAAAKGVPAPAKNAPAPEKATAKAEPAKPDAAKPASAPVPAAGGPGNGYAVQVAAVNARGEADAIVRRLSGKGYAAYVESPKGNVTAFRVRVGTFKTRREAQTVAEKLKKEEKFKPWVTR